MGKSLDISECRELLACFDNKWDGLVLIYLVALADDEGWVDCSVYVMAQRLSLHRQTLNRIIQRLCQRGYVVREGEDGKRLRVSYNVGTNSGPADLTVAEGISRDCLTSNTTDATVSEGGGRVDLRNDGASDAMDSESDGVVVMTGDVTSIVTGGVTSDVSSFVTGAVTDLCAQNDAINSCVSGKYEEENLRGVTSVVTGGVSSLVTTDVTQKETKENKEEIPPAPPKEEKKQKKEKSHDITRAREKNRHMWQGNEMAGDRSEFLQY